jgi:PTS system nitrogen regulatory IIA component
VAIPHGRISKLRDATGAMIRLKQPIPFDAPDGKPVDLIFVLLVPERATDMHLEILSTLAQMLSDKPFRDAMLAAPDAEALYQLIVKWQPYAENQRSQVV